MHKITSYTPKAHRQANTTFIVNGNEVEMDLCRGLKTTEIIRAMKTHYLVVIDIDKENLEKAM